MSDADKAIVLDLLDVSNRLQHSASVARDNGRDDIAETIRRCGELVWMQVHSLTARRVVLQTEAVS